MLAFVKRAAGNLLVRIPEINEVFISDLVIQLTGLFLPSLSCAEANWPPTIAAKVDISRERAKPAIILAKRSTLLVPRHFINSNPSCCAGR